MRTAFIEQLIIDARINPRIFLVVGDLGYSVVEPFANEFPNRFLNAGVAEQNMTGVAAGLAAEGYHVFTYSIGNFPTLRCLEQIRNDVVYHGLPVTVVAVGAGLAYGSLGHSHHAIQDIAIMRSLGEIGIWTPSDPGEARACVKHLSVNPRPSYLRLGKAGEPKLHEIVWDNGSPLQIRGGDSDLAIVACGSILENALKAADLLDRIGIRVTVFSCPKVHPLSIKDVSVLAGFRRLAVVEEHLESGGLFSALHEKMHRTMREGQLMLSIALSSSVLGRVGSQSYLREIGGLGPDSIAAKIFEWKSSL